MTNKQSWGDNWEEDYYLTFGYIDPKTFKLGKKFVERLLTSKAEQIEMERIQPPHKPEEFEKLKLDNDKLTKECCYDCRVQEKSVEDDWREKSEISGKVNFIVGKILSRWDNTGRMSSTDDEQKELIDLILHLQKETEDKTIKRFQELVQEELQKEIVKIKKETEDKWFRRYYLP